MGLRAHIKGDLGLVPPATGLELYRIAQEALANIVKHAPGAHADLDVEVGQQDVVLVVTNPVRNGARPFAARSTFSFSTANKISRPAATASSA